MQEILFAGNECGLSVIRFVSAESQSPFRFFPEYLLPDDLSSYPVAVLMLGNEDTGLLSFKIKFGIRLSAAVDMLIRISRYGEPEPVPGRI